MNNQTISSTSNVIPLTADVSDSINHQSDKDSYVDTQITQVMLTTSDNPFDPFTQFDSWFAFDESKNYNSCSYLARIAKTSDDLSDADNERAINQAIDEIVELNILGIYKKAIKTYTA